MNINKSAEEWKPILLGEVLLFRLLGHLLYQPLDKAFLDNLIEEKVFEEVPFGAEQKEVVLGLDLLNKWVNENASGVTDASFDNLRSDHMRLFVGVNKVLAAPWESIYFGKERLVFQEQTLKVRNWYGRFGLVPEKLGQEPDDHIGLEMIFISFLSELTLEALEEQDEKKVDELIEAQHQFLAEHLLQWGPVWCSSVKEHANTDFYRGLAVLISGTFFELCDHYNVQIPVEALEGVVSKGLNNSK